MTILYNKEANIKGKQFSEQNYDYLAIAEKRLF